MREFHKEMIAVTMQRQDMREACESIRHSLVYCMRCGDRLVIFLDKMVADFKNQFNYPPDHWPNHDINNSVSLSGDQIISI